MGLKDYNENGGKRTGIVPYIEHFWCHFGPRNYGWEEVTDDKPGTLHVCSECRYPLHRGTMLRIEQ